MQMCIQMEDYSARCNLVVWVMSHYSGNHLQYVQGCEVQISPWQSLFAGTGQVPTTWLAWMLKLTHHFRSSQPNTNSEALCRSALAALRHTVTWPGFIRFEHCLCILRVPNELLLSKVSRLSTARKLSHTETFATASKASFPRCCFLLYTSHFCSIETSSGQRWEASAIFGPLNSSLNQ